ncbi:DMT family transporter [Ktedonospora formicarum]|uniref:EamA domain-containing protein n=1 Tax=Ktedonospora formicarum TaxID=2778364 RepID=A0A8J3I4Q5_9CHLR|nr:DMT family transporter [Ktedonospora formicarum]GHO50222.1 hypothetical protein KSX_83850 [Ktedonospora formicarum]
MLWFWGVYTKVYARGAGSLALATCSQLGAGAFLLPFSVIAPPTRVPAMPVVLSVAALALVCTAFAYLLFFWLIEHVGPTRTLTVTFLVPIFGILWGVVLLHEPLTLSTFLGFGIILSGTGFVTGLRLRKRRPNLPQQVPVVREESSTALMR